MIPDRRRPPDLSPQDRLGAWGLSPSGTLTRILWQRNLAEPDLTAAFVQGSGAPPSLGHLIYDISTLALGSYPTNDASQGPGTRSKPRATDARGRPGDSPEARPCQLLLRQGHVRGMTQEDTASQRPPGAQGLLGPRVSPWSRPPSPPRRL
jgi:hypothetical protein